MANTCSGCLVNSKLLFQFELLENLYSTTLETLRETKNERLWFKTNTKVSVECGYIALRTYVDQCALSSAG